MSAETITAIAALVAAVSGFVVAFITAILAYRLKKSAAATKEAAEMNQAEIIATKDGVYELGKRLDGRLQELLKVSIANARKEGVAAGEQAQRERTAEPQPWSKP